MILSFIKCFINYDIHVMFQPISACFHPFNVIYASQNKDVTDYSYSTDLQSYDSPNDSMMNATAIYVALRMK